MRTVIVRDSMRIPLGKQGENNAVRVVWPGIAEKYAKLYGDGRFELVIVQKGKAYPAVVNVNGTDLVWDVLAADVATAEVGSLELIYYVGDTIAKSQTWETVVIASKSAEGTTEPPEGPARAWFDAIKRQIGDLSKLTTKDKENLVAAINEAARTGSGSGSVEMRVDGGYIQYSTDGVTWKNLIAVASLEGKPGKDGEPGEPGAPGKDGEPGKDGHTPKIAATKTGKTTSITADGVEIAQIKDGEDAAADLSLGITGAQVGQTIKVKAVDTDGKPTQWEPVEMAGGEREWVKVGAITTEEDSTETTWINFSKDVDGNSLELKGVLIICEPLFNDTKTHLLGLICNNENSNRNYLLYAPVLRNSQFSTVFSEFLMVDGNNSIVDTIYNSGNVKQHGGCESKVETWSPIDASMHMRYPMRGVKLMIRDAMLAGSTFEVWGVKA